MNNTSGHTDPNMTVRISAPARLHLGFLDLNGQIGRKFGSIGVAIDSHQTVIEVTASSQDETIITGKVLTTALKQRIHKIVEKFYTSLGQQIKLENRAVTIELQQAIPEHAGLGSGTQLTLTIASALCQFHAIQADTSEIAHSMGRGQRSGIGITTFDRGGFVVDAGLKPETQVPPAIIHHYFPPDWRIVMILDEGQQGVHGAQESTAFKTLPPFPQQHAQIICHQTLMKLVPALYEQDLENFGNAITVIQSLIGQHFAPAQGGDQYTSPKVAALLRYAHTLGHSGIAQSSWGPTGCIFVADEDRAMQLCDQLTEYTQLHIQNADTLSFVITQANQSGATIETSIEQ